jgi:outer membrane protein assembly factor BamB
MARLLDIWRSWSPTLQALVVSGVAVAVIAVGVVGYLIVKRPGDISNTDLAFHGGDKQHTISKTVDWPLYGYNRARTRYLPVKGLNPPFHRVWGYEVGTLLEFSPIIVDGTIYAMDNDARFFALDADTGKRKWKHDEGKLNASSPAYSDGRLFGVNLVPGHAFALRASDGRLIWRKPLPGRSEASPLVQGGRVYVGSESGDLFAFEAKSGKLVWHKKTDSSVKGGVAYNDGTVYVGDYAGQMYAFRAKDGVLRWKASDLGPGLGTTGRFYSTPAVAFGRVYAGDADGRVYSFEARTGKIAWTHSTGDDVYPAPAVADTPDTGPAVYIGSADGNAYALNARTGAEIWRKPVGGLVIGAGSVIGDVFYVSETENGTTAGFDIRNGKRVFGFSKGEYNPAISDGRRVYLTGYSSITALAPKAQKGKQGGPGNRRKKDGAGKHAGGGGKGHGKKKSAAGKHAGGGGKRHGKKKGG